MTKKLPLLALIVGCAGSSGAPAPAPAPPPPAPVVVAAPPVDAGVADAAPAPKPWPHGSPQSVRGTKGVVTTDNHFASKIGSEVLASGGNAADASVAIALAMAVTYQAAGNIGGGGFAVTKFKGETKALDFRETAPAAATRDMFLGADGKPKKEAREGVRSVGVPGSVAGLYELHKTLGSKKKTWAELVAPAIKLADEGFLVDESLLHTLEFMARAGVESTRLKTHPVSAALFLPNGAPPPKGSIFKNPDLAKTLKRIAAKGPAGFYEGETATAIAQQMKEENGLITTADLKAYKAKWRKPVEFTYRGYKVASMPPPSSGGVTMAMIAKILEGYELGKLGFQSPETIHYEIEAMRRAYAARNARLGDPDFVKNPIDDLLSDAWAKEQRSTIKDDRATPSSEIVAKPASAAGPHTTHFSVVDADGNAVALTTTVNLWYGSGVTVKGCGFVLNNEMDDFATVPGTANAFGLVQGEANAVAPGKRMLSSMSPTIVTAPDGKIILVLGGAGGSTITTTVFQEISNVIDFGLDVGAAIGSPRFHMQHLPDEVIYEEGGLKPELGKRLESMGYKLKERGHIADAPGIGRVGNDWIGVAEPRAVGGLAAAP